MEKIIDVQNVVKRKQKSDDLEIYKITKYICNYIKEHDLQNPKDRRQIKADPKLSKLLNYDSKRDDPLTYYRLQTHMKRHFIKPDEVKK